MSFYLSNLWPVDNHFAYLSQLQCGKLRLLNLHLQYWNLCKRYFSISFRVKLELFLAILKFTWHFFNFMFRIFFLTKSCLSERNCFSSIDVAIYVTHRDNPNRKYRVKGLTKDGASTQTFPFERDGITSQMTVKTYFEGELKYPLRYNSC